MQNHHLAKMHKRNEEHDDAEVLSSVLKALSINPNLNENERMFLCCQLSNLFDLSEQVLSNKMSMQVKKIFVEVLSFVECQIK